MSQGKGKAIMKLLREEGQERGEKAGRRAEKEREGVKKSEQHESGILMGRHKSERGGLSFQINPGL